MKHFGEHEGVIDEQIVKLNDKLRHNFAQNNEIRLCGVGSVSILPWAFLLKLFLRIFSLVR